MARKDLPNPSAPNYLQRVREEIHALLGKTGSASERALTLRDAIESGVIVPGPGGSLIPGPGAGGAYDPDLTPPPQPGAFTLTGNISHYLIEQAQPFYTQGHGHLRTHVYAASHTAGDPLPVFTDAVPVTQFDGTIFAVPSNPATTWRVWIKWESVDGELSATPSGGTNGQAVTTGQDIGSMLDALTGQISASQLANDLSTPIGQIPGLVSGLAQEALDRANAIAQEAADRASDLAQEASDRAAAISAASSAQASALAAEVSNRASAISAVDSAIRADLATADAAVVSSLTSAFTSADAATLASAQSYTFSKTEINSAIAALGTQLTTNYQSADAATLAAAQTFTYSRSAIDAADAATLSTLRAEFAAADSTTLASAQNYTYAKATIDSAIATSASTLRAQLTGGSTATDLNALTGGLIYQMRQVSQAADDSLAQQLTLLSAGAGEQFDYSNIWYYDAGADGWTANNTTSTTISAVSGWLRMAASTGTQAGRMFQSPAALAIDGAKYPQVRLRLRKVGAPTWVGRLYFITTADGAWDTTKSVLADEPTYDANGIGLLTFNMPAGWTGATIAQVRFEASTNVTTSAYFELDWVAIGRPSPGASSAQLTAEQIARQNGDSANAAEILSLQAEVAGKASASALSSLEARVTSAEGVNTSQGASITSLSNSLTTLTGTVNNKAEASALTALDTRVTAAEGVNTSQGNSITTLNNNVSTLTTNLATKADASALTALTTRVTAAEGVNTTQSGSITSLTNSLNTLTDTVATKASASALSDLATRVTATENTNTSQATSITSLSTSLSTTNTNVTAAQTAANNAATLAGSKGKVMVQSTAPAAGDQLAQNLWIDTTGGANTPKRWSGSAWVAVTDKVATDAAAAAAAAQATANSKADASALTALTTRVTTAEGTITSQGTRLNSLESTVNNATTGVAATAAALDVVETLVNNGTTGVAATAMKVGQLEVSLATTNTNVATAQTTANNAATAAANAQTTANTASTNAATANSLLSDIASDAKLTPIEKQSVRSEWNVVAAEKAGINTQASTFGVTTENTTYNNAFQALANYLNAGTAWSSGVPSWISDANLSTTTTIVGATFRSNWQSLYTARTALLNRIAARAKELADAAQTAANNANTLAGTKADASALATTNTNVSNLNGTVTALSTDYNTLKAAVNNATTGLSSKASITYVDQAEADAVSASAAAIATLQSRVERGGSLTPRLEDWKNLAGHNIVTIADGKVGDKALRLTNVVSNPNSGVVVPIDRTKTYRVRFWARPSADCNGTLYHGLQQYQDAGATVFGPLNSGLSPYKPNNFTRAQHNTLFGGTDQWGEYSYLWTSADWQAGVTHVRSTFLRNYPGGAGITGWWEIQDYEFREVTELQSLSASISTEASTRATQTGELYAQYTVKTDVAGLVSGYGLASTSNNAVPTSAFGVQASQFFVAPPAVASATEPTSGLFKGYAWRDTVANVTKYWTGSAWSTTPQALPFVVQTVPQTINGVEVQPGVYFENAFFARLVATRGQIGLLAVDDARIADLSVSKLTAGSIAVGQFAQSTGYVAGSSGWRINGDGNAEFSNAIVRGTVYATDGEFTGTVRGATIIGGTLTTAESGQRVKIDEQGILFLTGASNGKYGSFKYGAKKYGDGVLVYFNNTIKRVPFYVNSEQNVADIHLYNRAANPPPGEPGDIICVNSRLKTWDGIEGRWRTLAFSD